MDWCPRPHNLLDFLKKTRHKLAIQKGEVLEHHVAHRLYLRMTFNERLQHAVLVLSFTALVVTGFMLRYPEAWWVVAIRHLSGRAFEFRGLAHRVASVIMLASGAWHVGYLAFTGKRNFYGGKPKQVLDLASAGKLQLLISLPLKLELERVLRDKFDFPPSELAANADLLWSSAQWIAPRQRLSLCSDEPDNRVLECALEGHADFIVTRNVDDFAGSPVPALTPEAFLLAHP